MTSLDLSESQLSSLKQILKDCGFTHKKNNTINGMSGKYRSIASFCSSTSLLKKMASKKELSELSLLALGEETEFFQIILSVMDEMTEVAPGKLDGVRRLDIESSKDYDKITAVVLETRSSSDCIGLVNVEERRVVREVHPDIWMMSKGVSVPELVANPNVARVTPIFNPFREDFIYPDLDSYGVKSSFLNFYQPPPWKAIKVTPRFGGFIQKLFEHLLPIYEDREFVLDWFHHALVTKNATLLCLVGARGTGKTILLDDIARPLFGEPMYARGNQSLVEEKFNPQFENRRFVFLDEVDLEEETAVSKIKAYTNDTISIEKKGCDPYTTNNYVSLGLATNIRDRFKVEPQERRFSVPRVAEKNLNTAIHPDEISDFLQRIKNPMSEEIAEFGHWLLQRVPKYDNQTPYKGAYFYELCDLTMPDWKTFLRDFLGSAEYGDAQFIFKDVQKAFGSRNGGKGGATFTPGPSNSPKFPVRRKTVEEFLFQYRYLGEYKIADTYDCKDSNGRPAWGISVNYDFWKAYRANVETEVKAEDLL